MDKFTRIHARMVAEELAKLIKPEIRRMVKESVIEETDEMLRVEKVAALLGCSKWAVYRRVGEIPHVKRGNIIYFSKNEVMRYIKGN